MLDEFRFAVYAIKKNIQSSAELRTSFVMNVIGMSVNNIAFILLWVFFVRSVGVVGGWTAVDIIGLQGFVALCFGLVFSFGSGIRKLPDYVAQGVFDRFMLSPKHLLVRVGTAAFAPAALGDFMFGVVCLVIYGVLIHATIVHVGFMLALAAATTLLFLATTVIIYSASFLFTDARSVVDGFFEMFFTPSLFHGGAFQGMVRVFFIFIIPSLLIGTVPVEAVRDLSFTKLGLVVIFSVVWFVLSVKMFSWAVRRYESSNLMSFGE